MKKTFALIALAIAALTVSIPATAQTIELNKKTFLEKVVNYEKNPNAWNYLGSKPAIIDFYATWCPPCKKLSPVLEELSKEYKDKIVIYKVDVDKERELSSVMGIRSMPTLIFIPMSENPQVLNGAYPKEEIKKMIEKVLLKK